MELVTPATGPRVTFGDRVGDIAVRLSRLLERVGAPDDVRAEVIEQIADASGVSLPSDSGPGDWVAAVEGYLVAEPDRLALPDIDADDPELEILEWIAQALP